jgi:hypothetical protein
MWVAGALLFLALAALVLGGSREPGIGMLALIVAAAALAAAGLTLLVWAIAYQRLGYSLTDSALRINWLGRTLVVPYSAIQGIYTGHRLSDHATPGTPRWPGINVGHARVRGLGRLRFFATSSDQSMLTFIAVEHGGVIVSARDPQEFRAALIERVEQSSEALAAPEVLLVKQTPPTDPPWTALTDPWMAIWVAIGTLVLLLIVAVIALRFAALPDQIALHFDASGRPNQIASKSELMRLPALGLVCLVIDWLVGVWVHPREPALARLLWLGGAIVQAILLIGVLRLVT